MGEIRVGTSGYSIPDWKGTVYPANIKDADMFSCYVNQFRFKTVEMNYTYYRQPVARTFDALLKKSPVDFDFTIKLYGGITHEPWKDPQPRVDIELCSQFLDGIKPVVESGKLGCLLAQFPMSVSRSEEAWDYISALPEAFDGLPLIFEFRNKSWVSEETVQRLKAGGIGFCAVDEPKMGSLMPLIPAVTSDIAYLRLHGRSENWFKDKALRYDYLYSEGELQKLLPTISRMSAASRALYIMFNNCHAGSAVMNVKMLLDLLGMDAPIDQGLLFL
jgi:uncharacterized protein YecE (DUF72 family)